MVNPSATATAAPPTPAPAKTSFIPPALVPLPPRLFVPIPPSFQRVTDHVPFGTRVSRGEVLIVNTAGAAHVPLAPADGIITGASEVQLLDGRRVTALHLDVDPVAPPAPAPESHIASPPPPPPPRAADHGEIRDLPTLIERLRLAGVWAERLTSPDLLGQLHEAIRRPIDTLVCNLLDADGGSALSAKLVREHGGTIIAGVSQLARATGASKVFLAADPRLADRAAVFVRKAGPAGRAVKVVPLANDYPQADPTMLLYALSGRRLRPDKLPPEVGALVLDAAAAIAVGRATQTADASAVGPTIHIADASAVGRAIQATDASAVGPVTQTEAADASTGPAGDAARAGDPGRGADPLRGAMLTVPIEVRDSARSRSLVTRAAVGTPLRAVLEALGLTRPFTLRAGAALRDVRLSPDAVVAGTELTVDAGPLAPPINPDPCIRCGWCVENCPVRINPAGILEAAQENDRGEAERHGLHACIECGICSYVCPSRLPLLESVREVRAGMRG